MEEIRIEAKLTLKEYTRLMYRLTYTKPMMILLTLIGLGMLVLSASYFLGYQEFMMEPPYYQFIFSLFIVGYLPFSVYRSSKKNFTSNERLKEPIVYEFNQDSIQIKGESFNSLKDWSKIYKIHELSDWVLIYESKLVANIIPKEAFDEEQLRSFRQLVKDIPNVNSKLRK